MTDKHTEKRTETHACDLISREAAINKINERQRKLIYCFGFENDAVEMFKYSMESTSFL